jgi:hypothetical protein
MAKTRSKKNAGRRVSRKHYSARKSARRNPRRHRHVSHRRRSVKRNPGRMGGGITSVLIDAGWAGAGAVASRAIPNMLLTSMNTGVVGYGANIITGLALAWGARSFLKNSRAAADIMLGTMIGVIFRAVQDFTPYGKYAALNGMGDFQITEFFAPRIIGDTGTLDPSQSLKLAAAANAHAASASASGRSLGAFYRRSFINR